MSLSRYTITLKVSYYVKRQDTEGSVGCIVMTNISQIQSYATIWSSGQVTNFTNTLSSMTMTRQDLIPDTKYGVLCAMRISGSYYSSVWNTSSNKISFRTSCCSDITLINTPSYIYSDLSLYSVGDRLKYTFIFQLANLPWQNVILTPIVYDNNQSIATNISILPLSFTFTSSSSSVRGEFIVISNTLYSTDYTIYFNTSGINGRSYFNPSLSFVVIGSSQSLPAPRMASASFSSDGFFIYINFNVPTNRAGMNSDRFNCSLLFTFQSSPSALCQWVNETTIQVFLSTSLTTNQFIYPLDNIDFISTNLQAKCVGSSDCSRYQNSSSHSLQLASLSTIISPVVILQSPLVVSICDNYTIDASLSYNRGYAPWKGISWIIFDTTNKQVRRDIMIYMNSKSIDGIISIPKQYLMQGSIYQFTLQLENIFGFTSNSSISVRVVGLTNLISLSVVGSNTIVTYAKDSLQIDINIKTASCAVLSEGLSISKYLTSQDVVLPLVSQSNDPKKFTLSSYSLNSGKTYELVYNVSTTVLTGGRSYPTYAVTTVQITVLKGKVISSIAGGSVISYPIDRYLTLDATASYDEDSLSSVLSYKWSCLVISLPSYGQDCTSILDDAAINTNQLLLTPLSLNSSDIYSFTVIVTSLDNRYSISSITVIPQFNGASVYLSYPITIVNVNSVISLSALITSNYSVNASWTMYSNNEIIELSTAITPLSTSFTMNEASNGINYPVAFQPYTFQEGRSYTFRLSTYSLINPDYISFAEATIVMNISPFGGTITINPSSGYEFSTIFLLRSINWLTLPSNYPLSYDFTYKISDYQTALNLGDRSPITTIYSELPAGLEYNGHSYDVFVTVHDAYSASSKASTGVIVKPMETMNTIELSEILSTSLQAIDISNIIRHINILSTSMNQVNCSLASIDYCTAFNRYNCEAFANTCGPCLEGYSGVIGPHDSPCNIVVSNDPFLQTSCRNDSDCLSGRCGYDNICVYPSKTCPSSTSFECSNHGQCVFVDTSNNLIDNCDVTDSRCFAKCLCDSNYGGIDCSLDSEAVSERDIIRTTMCQSLLNISSIQDQSGSLVDIMVSSLQSAFDPYEVISLKGKNTCLQVLYFISMMANEGYLQDSQTITTSILIDLFSNYLNSGMFQDSEAIYDGNITYSEVLNTIHDNINKGIVLTRVDGQEDSSYVSELVQILVISPRSTAIQNSLIEAPKTSSDSAYGKMSQTISFVDSLSSCSNTYGYSSFSLTQYLKSPVGQSSDLLNPFMILSTYSSSQSSIIASSERIQAYSKAIRYSSFPRSIDIPSFDMDYRLSMDKSPSEAMVGVIKSKKQELDYVPAFYITMQFSQIQFFNFSIDFFSDGPVRYPSNATMPSCNIFDPKTSTYESCDRCNISSYNDYNVTYACADISILCQSSSFEGIPSRRLQSYGNDDSKYSTQYSNMFASLLQTFDETILSYHSFNISHNQTALLMVSGVIFTSIIGLLYFSLWDRFDHDNIIYIKKDSKASANKRNKTQYFQGNSKDRLMERTKIYMKTYIKVFDDLSLKNSLHPSAVCLDDITFPKHLLHLHGKMRLFLISLCRENIYLAPFFGMSLRRSRQLRWIFLIHSLLLVAFIDTLFFQTFYPINNNCSTHTSRIVCLSSVNKAINRPFCMWTADVDGNLTQYGGRCDQRPPPSSFTFILLLVLLTFIITLPMQLLQEYVTEEYAGKIPDLDVLGISTIYWFGSSTISQGFTYQRRDSQANMTMISSEIGRGPVDTSQSNHVDVGSFFLKKIPGVRIHQVASMNGSSTALRANLSRTKTMLHRHGSLESIISTPLVEHRDRTIPSSYRTFRSYLTIEEEFLDLMNRFQGFVSQIKVRGYIPWIDFNFIELRDYQAKLKYIMKELGMNQDGTMIPLTMSQILLYRSNQSRIQIKLFKARNQAVQILNNLRQIDKKDIQLQNALLLQHFILEQMPFMKRYLLSRQFFHFHTISPEKIHPLIWLFAWIYILGSLLFYCYWILIWSMTTGNYNFKLWGLSFGLVILQDILFNQTMKIYLLNVAGITSIQTQLRNIFYALNDVSLRISNGSPMDIHVPQNNEICLAHHFSPSCRVALLHEVSYLDAAILIRSITDFDVIKCHQNRLDHLGFITYICVLIPGLIAFFNNRSINKVLDVMIPALLSAFLLINQLLLSISPWLLAFFYIIIIVLILWEYGVLASAIQMIDSAISRLFRGSKRSSRSLSNRTNLIQRKELFFESLKHISYVHASSWTFKSPWDRYFYSINHSISFFIDNIRGRPSNRPSQGEYIDYEWLNVNIPECFRDETLSDSSQDNHQASEVVDNMFNYNNPLSTRQSDPIKPIQRQYSSTVESLKAFQKKTTTSNQSQSETNQGPNLIKQKSSKGSRSRPSRMRERLSESIRMKRLSLESETNDFGIEAAFTHRPSIFTGINILLSHDSSNSPSYGPNHITSLECHEPVIPMEVEEMMTSSEILSLFHHRKMHRTTSFYDLIALSFMRDYSMDPYERLYDRYVADIGGVDDKIVVNVIIEVPPLVQLYRDQIITTNLHEALNRIKRQLIHLRWYLKRSFSFASQSSKRMDPSAKERPTRQEPGDKETHKQGTIPPTDPSSSEGRNEYVFEEDCHEKEQQDEPEFVLGGVSDDIMTREVIEKAIKKTKNPSAFPQSRPFRYFQSKEKKDESLPLSRPNEEAEIVQDESMKSVHVMDHVSLEELDEHYSMEEYLIAMEDLWSYYHPNNYILSKEEIQEVIDRFVAWSIDLKHPINQLDDVYSISIIDFTSWFENIVQLISHVRKTIDYEVIFDTKRDAMRESIKGDDPAHETTPARPKIVVKAPIDSNEGMEDKPVSSDRSHEKSSSVSIHPHFAKYLDRSRSFALEPPRYVSLQNKNPHEKKRIISLRNIFKRYKTTSSSSSSKISTKQSSRKKYRKSDLSKSLAKDVEFLSADSTNISQESRNKPPTSLDKDDLSINQDVEDLCPDNAPAMATFDRYYRNYYSNPSRKVLSRSLRPYPTSSRENNEPVSRSGHALKHLNVDSIAPSSSEDTDHRLSIDGSDGRSDHSALMNNIKEEAKENVSVASERDSLSLSSGDIVSIEDEVVEEKGNAQEATAIGNQSINQRMNASKEATIPLKKELAADIPNMKASGRDVSPLGKTSYDSSKDNMTNIAPNQVASSLTMSASSIKRDSPQLIDKESRYPEPIASSSSVAHTGIPPLTPPISMRDDRQGRKIQPPGRQKNQKEIKAKTSQSKKRADTIAAEMLI